MLEMDCLNDAVRYMSCHQENHPYTDCFLHVGPLYTIINSYQRTPERYRYEVSIKEDEGHISLGHIQALTGPYENSIIRYD